ncbi:MAG: RimK/LysX family protein [bacterium]|nr:RimK/LysX family protein [bacterium]
MEQQEYTVIGRREWVNFTDLNLSKIEAKIDTGAYTSSIHCHHIAVDGDRVTCIFLDPSHSQYTGEELTFEIFKSVKVRSSNGQEEFRYMIRTQIEILGTHYPIRLTLTDRSNMNYPILIGRRFLRNKFLVDVNRIHQSTEL